MKKTMFQSMLGLEIRVLLRSKWLLSFFVLFIGLSFLLYFYGIESAKSTSQELAVSTGSSHQVNTQKIQGYYLEEWGIDAEILKDLKAANGEGGTVTEEVVVSNAYSRSIAMLINLSLWILPIICLILGTNSIVADKEEGRFSLYRTYQSPMIFYLVSKYVSLCVSLIITLGLSYGLFGLFLFIKGSLIDAAMFGIFLSLNLFIVLVFSGLAVLIGSYSVTRMQGLSLALFAWSFLVFVYEFIVFSVIDNIAYGQKLSALFVFILANPIESVRVWAINQLGANYIFGPQYLILNEWGANGTLNAYFFTSLAVIIITSLVLSMLIIKRRVV